MSGGSKFVDALAEQLARRTLSLNNDWMLGQLADRIVEFAHAPPPGGPVQMSVDPSALHVVDDSTMIHDMLRRGYAVMKIPERGRLEIDTTQRS